MKKLIAIMLLSTLIVGCSQKPKSPVEARFERFINTEKLTNDYIGVDSIVLLDSVNLSAHYDELLAYNDSIKTALYEEMELASNNFGKVRNEKEAIEATKLVLRLSEATDEDVESPIKEKISIFLEDIPNADGWYATYRIVAKFKNGERIYYAHNFAFEDTITISTEIAGGLTRKAERITEYFVDYMVKVSAPKSVLLGDVRDFRKKISDR